MTKIEELQKMIDESENIVAFTGAGISTLSGIKDFRSDDGLYKSAREKYPYPPEYMLSVDCFYKDPKAFYEFYKSELNSLEAKPNIVHEYLKKLEDSGKLKAIITQNIDGLHSKAGCRNVYELHGTVYKNYCIKCHKEYSGSCVFQSKGVLVCECGGIIKPQVVLYGEALPEKEFQKSIERVEHADMLLVLGTSLTVFPACNMVNYFRGKYLVIINLDETPFDKKADLVIHDDLKDVFCALK